MIVIEYPYINKKGNEDYSLVKRYSDLGCDIKQVETGKIMAVAVDFVKKQFHYIELTSQTGQIPDEMIEDLPDELKNADRAQLEREGHITEIPPELYETGTNESNMEDITPERPDPAILKPEELE